MKALSCGGNGSTTRLPIVVHRALHSEGDARNVELYIQIVLAAVKLAKEKYGSDPYALCRASSNGNRLSQGTGFTMTRSSGGFGRAAPWSWSVALTKTNCPANSASRRTASNRHWRTALGPQSLKRISNSTCQDSGCRSAMNGRKAPSIRRESVLYSRGKRGVCWSFVENAVSDRENSISLPMKQANASPACRQWVPRAR